MTGRKTRALQVPQIVPYNALGKFPKEVQCMRYGGPEWQPLMLPHKEDWTSVSHIIRGGSRGRVQGVRIPPPPEMTFGFLIQLVFTSGHQSVTPIHTGAPPPRKNPGSAPVIIPAKHFLWQSSFSDITIFTVEFFRVQPGLSRPPSYYRYLELVITITSVLACELKLILQLNNSLNMISRLYSQIWRKVSDDWNPFFTKLLLNLGLTNAFVSWVMLTTARRASQ